MIDETAQEAARRVRAENVLADALFKGLAHIDEMMGGADTWDERPMCEGTAFAVISTSLDGVAEIGAAILPETSQRIYESHGADEPGATGRAVSRVVLRIKAGDYPKDLAELVQDPTVEILAVGFGAEAWAVTRDTPTRGPDEKWIKDLPDRTEIRFICMIDYNGLQFVHYRQRGQEPVVGVYMMDQRPDTGFTGKIPTALRVLIHALDLPATTTAN